MSKLYFIPTREDSALASLSYPPCRRCGGRDTFGAAWCLKDYCLNCKGLEKRIEAKVEQQRQKRQEARQKASERRRWTFVGMAFLTTTGLVWACRAAGVI